MAGERVKIDDGDPVGISQTVDKRCLGLAGNLTQCLATEVEGKVSFTAELRETIRLSGLRSNYGIAPVIA